MYQPETEDLIPRCAPKPSTSAVNEAIVRPSVPEVSIVFSQPELSSQSSCTPPSATTSYAAWKRQCVPQIVCPSTAENLNTDFSVMATRSNVYPMRTASSVVPPINLKPEPSNTFRRNAGVSVQSQCNIESTMAHCNPTYTVTTPCCKLNYNSSHQRKSIDLVANIPAHGMDTNILTICAGTQTDSLRENNSNELDINNLATKEDVAQMRTMLAGMRTEQRRLIEIVQHLLVVQGRKQEEIASHTLRDVSTQCDAQPVVGPLPQKRPHIRYDSIEEEDSAEEDDSYRFPKKTNIPTETPPKIQPFQSQAFRAAFHPRSDVVSGLPKPATEQSMVMNELALKYLPNEKLSELLQELHVSPLGPPTQKVQKVYDSPLKNIENYDKSPTDLSTASYKYLKKYRLLPEENNNLLPSGNVRKVHSPNQQENMLDLETIRRQPKFM